MMEDVYLVRENTIDKNLTLEIYIFGVLGVDLPLSLLIYFNYRGWIG